MARNAYSFNNIPKLNANNLRLHFQSSNFTINTSHKHLNCCTQKTNDEQKKRAGNSQREKERNKEEKKCQ